MEVEVEVEVAEVAAEITALRESSDLGAFPSGSASAFSQPPGRSGPLPDPTSTYTPSPGERLCMPPSLKRCPWECVVLSTVMQGSKVCAKFPDGMIFGEKKISTGLSGGAAGRPGAELVFFAGPVVGWHVKICFSHGRAARGRVGHSKHLM